MARNADSPDFEPVVIVFKPKERRENPVRDKLDVVRSVMAGRRAADLRFYEGARQPLGRFAMAGTQASEASVPGLGTYSKPIYPP